MAGQPQIQVFHDLASFTAATNASLEYNEAENSRLLGLQAALLNVPTSVNLFMAQVSFGERPPFIAFNTEKNLVLTAGEDAEIDLLATTMHQMGAVIPSVIGPRYTSDRFAQTWCSITGKKILSSMKQRLYSLQRVNPAISAEGFSRLAEDSDLQTVFDFVSGFSRDVAPLQAANEEQEMSAAKTIIDEKRGFLWEADGLSVSMAAHSRPTRNTVTVNAVYTPAKYRRHGFASALVAAVSQRGLDSGKSSIVLYTDLSNPTSNSIYMKIGYEAVSDSSLYFFQR